MRGARAVAPDGRGRRGLRPFGFGGRRPAAGQRQQAAARGGGRRGYGPAGEPGPYRPFGEHLAALQERCGDRSAALEAQCGQILRAGVVTCGQGVLEQFQIAGGGAGKGVSVADEVGEEERAQPSRLAGHLVDGARKPQAVLDIVVGQGRGVEGVGEGASEHSQLVRAERHTAA